MYRVQKLYTEEKVVLSEKVRLSWLGYAGYYVWSPCNNPYVIKIHVPQSMLN